MANAAIKCPQCGGDKNFQSGTNQYTCQYCGATFVNASEVVESAAAPTLTRCRFCGGEIPFGASKCRHCGEWQNVPVQPAPVQPVMPQPAYQPVTSTKNKIVAAVLALFLGGLGIHEFYLGRSGAGIAILLINLFTCWLIFPIFIIWLICVCQAISYLAMSDQQFAEKYH